MKVNQAIKMNICTIPDVSHTSPGRMVVSVKANVKTNTRTACNTKKLPCAIIVRIV
jgi:hypothetical protein